MTNTRTQQFALHHLPLLIFLGPVIGVNLAYVIASSLDHVPDCITYISGCTSISSAGRLMPQKGIFLLSMIPTAVLSVWFWTKAEHWFGDNRQSADKTLINCGAVASFFLLIYVTTLGIPGDFYSLTRKLGVLLYFGFTYIAQLILAKRLYAVALLTDQPHLTALANRLKWYCVFVMALGLLIIPISLIEDPVYRKQLENILEWNYAFLICGYFLIVHLTWRQHSLIFQSQNVSVTGTLPD